MKHYLMYCSMVVLATPLFAMEITQEKIEDDALLSAVALASNYKIELDEAIIERDEALTKNTRLKAKLDESSAAEAYAENNHKKAFEIFSLLEKNSNLPDWLKITSRYYLGALLFNGNGIHLDVLMAEKFLKLAADQTYIPVIAAKAQLSLGELYSCQNKWVDASTCFKQVVGSINAPQDLKLKSCRYLGEIFFYGKPGIEANKAEACKYLAQISNQDANLEAKAFACQCLGIDDYNNDKFEDALKHLLIVDALNVPGYKKNTTWYYLGLVYFKKNETSRAKKYFVKAKETNDSTVKTGVYEYLLKIAGKKIEAAISLHNEKKYKEAKKSLKKIVTDNDLPTLDLTQAYYYLAEVCFNGLTGKGNYPLALQYYEKVLDQQKYPELIAVAAYKVGKMYYFGLGTNKNYQQARINFERAEIQHDAYAYAFASRCLGEIYYRGLGIHQPDFAKAFTHFNNALNQTFDKESQEIARVNLGEMYYQGKGTHEDFAKAREYFEYVANNDTNAARVAVACYYLGKMWYQGNGVGADAKKSFDYFQKAARSRTSKLISILVSRYLAEMYYYGKGTEKNYGLAEFELLKLENQDVDPEARAFALYHLGELCQYAIGSKREEDKPAAMGYFEKAKNQDDNLIVKDYATRFFADKNYADNKHDLADELYQSIKHDKYTAAYARCRQGNISYAKGDFQKAAVFYKEAADQNLNRTAQTESASALSVMYEQGKGVEKNANEALKYKNIATQEIHN